MIDYTKPTPETDAFMAKIDGDEIDLEMVRAKLHDMEVQRDVALKALVALDVMYRSDKDEPGQRPKWLQDVLDLSNTSREAR
jgi:hypothetical protein